jgi:copper chaperone CopZ
MKNIFLLLAMVFSMAATAQVTEVHLQASGLTCSMCSNAINKALKTLDFVDKVEANMKRYTFTISFKEGSTVDFDRIRRKVEDAGFSVSAFTATIYLNNVQVLNNQPITIGNHRLVFVNSKSEALTGFRQVTVLDKGFVPPKEYKRNSFDKSLADAGLFHVKL